MFWDNLLGQSPLRLDLDISDNHPTCSQNRRNLEEHQHNSASIITEPIKQTLGSRQEKY
jgi:hypothetical protein